MFRLVLIRLQAAQGRVRGLCNYVRDVIEELDLIVVADIRKL